MIKFTGRTLAAALAIGLFCIAQTPRLLAQSDDDVFLQDDEDLDEDHSAAATDEDAGLDESKDAADEDAFEDQDLAEDAAAAEDEDAMADDTAGAQDVDKPEGVSDVDEPAPPVTPPAAPEAPTSPPPPAAPIPPPGVGRVTSGTHKPKFECPTGTVVVNSEQAKHFKSSCNFKCRDTNDHGLYYCDPP